MSSHGDNWTPEQRAYYHKQWRKRNPRSKEEASEQNHLFWVRHKGEFAERVKANREIRNRFKMRPCLDCGVQYNPWVMEFDHVRGKKRFNLAKSYSRLLPTVIEEINKCEVVCANCHKERTYRRMKEKGEIPI